MAKTIRLAKGDILVNSAGKVETVDSITKAAQDVAVALLQDFNAAQDFGSELSNLQDPQHSGLGAFQGLIGQKVVQAVNRLIRLQELDRDRVGPEERIAEIRDINIRQLNDLLSFLFVLTVVVESGDSTLKAMQIDLSHQLPDSLLPNVPGIEN